MGVSRLAAFSTGTATGTSGNTTESGSMPAAGSPHAQAMHRVGSAPDAFVWAGPEGASMGQVASETLQLARAVVSAGGVTVRQYQQDNITPRTSSTATDEGGTTRVAVKLGGLETNHMPGRGQSHCGALYIFGVWPPAESRASGGQNRG